PGNYPLGTPLTVKIIDHGFRSITGIRIPFAINQASLQELESIPGLGKKRARRIFLNLPIQGPAHLAEVLDPQAPLELLINLIDGY
ncbi:MAG: radical SAM protein, partial [Limnochordia bacterium]